MTEIEEWVKNLPRCDTCKFLLPIHCHPWNKDISKGNMSDRLGWACSLYVEDGRPLIFMDSSQETCECHATEQQQTGGKAE